MTTAPSMSGRPSTDVASILGADAQALLGYESKTVSKSKIHLPGPDFVDRVFSQSDRSPGRREHDVMDGDDRQ